MALRSVFLIMWDPKRGPYIKGKWPPDYDVSQELVIKVYGANVLVERVEGYHEVRHDGLSIPSYYSGFELNIILAAVVEGEEADVYREGLLTIAPILFKKRGVLTTEREWREVFEIMESMPRMVHEEKVAYAISDPVKRAIIEHLSAVSFATLDELRVHLKESFAHITKAEVMGHVDLLERLNIVKRVWLPGEAEERVLLVRDPVFLRVLPPLIEEHPELAVKVKGFFDGYDWKKDQGVISSAIARAGVYRTLHALEGMRVPRSRLLNIPDAELERLIEAGVFERDGDELIVLNVPKLFEIFPKYIVGEILKRVREEQLSPEAAVEFLRAMRNAYLK